MLVSKTKPLPKRIFGKIQRIMWMVLARTYPWNDFFIYARRIGGYRRLVGNMPVDPTKGSLLIVSGRGMNVVWAQMWTVLSLAARAKGFRAFVLTTRQQDSLNRYFQLLGINPVYLEDYIAKMSSALPEEVAGKLAVARSVEDFRRLSYGKAPIGEIALSTYCRYNGTGSIDLSRPEVRQFVEQWLAQIVQAIHIAEAIFESHDVRLAFFTEVFMEEYGAFYYAALAKHLNVTRFAGTVRDDAIIIQHLSRSNDRTHHSSLSPSSWAWVKAQPYTPAIDAALHKNFMDRYGDRWHRSKRNQPGTQILERDEARRQLGLSPDRKVAVIFSHILYDTLFFFGTNLFSDYVEWLVETVRAACANPGIDWLIKVHPSNLWRGELNTLLNGRYEEEIVIEQAIGKLPPHVRIAPASTKINPYSWFQLADYGITVRGTSGLEMAALGKTVITAGTGRYEGNGFTVDPPTREAYLKLLSRLPDLPAPTAEQVELAKRYAYSIFSLKPFTVISLVPRLKTGKRRVLASDDIIYCPSPWAKNSLPPDLQVFSDWLVQPENQDLLNAWGVS
jgi:hypothetical protein